MAYTLRPMQPSDGAALTQLMENDPPGEGGMSMTTRFQVDAWQAWTTLKDDLVGVVAEDSSDEMVGAATVSFEAVQFNGVVLPGAFLENLKVHHAHRGKGLGTQLAQWRVEQARARFGENGVIMTGTSTNNTASINTMKKWCKQFFSPMHVAIRPARVNAPAPLAGITVRAPQPHEFEQVAERSNHFYAAYNLYTPLQAAQLAPGGVHEYRVAVDRHGSVLAGVMLSNRGKLMVDTISNIPAPLKLMNRVLHIVPDDGNVRLVECSGLWFAPDQMRVAQHLWQSVRYEFREQASSITHNFDPRSPLIDVFQIKPWHVPKIELIYAIAGPTLMDLSQWVTGGTRG